MRSIEGNTMDQQRAEEAMQVEKKNGVVSNSTWPPRQLLDHVGFSPYVSFRHHWLVCEIMVGAYVNEVSITNNLKCGIERDCVKLVQFWALINSVVFRSKLIQKH